MQSLLSSFLCVTSFAVTKHLMGSSCREEGFILAYGSGDTVHHEEEGLLVTFHPVWKERASRKCGWATHSYLQGSTSFRVHGFPSQYYQGPNACTLEPVWGQFTFQLQHGLVGR